MTDDKPRYLLVVLRVADHASGLFKIIKTYQIKKSVVRRLWSVVYSDVDNLVENVLETTTEKIWKRIHWECIFNSQD